MRLNHKFSRLLTSKIFWLSVLVLAISLVYLAQFSLGIKGSFLTDADGHRTQIALPYIQEMPETEYTISGTIFYQRILCPEMVHIIPDDVLLSIRVNQRDVPLDDVDPGALSDFNQGFHFNLSRYLQNGPNHIEIRIKNTGGPSGLIFRNSARDIRALIAGWLLMIAVLAILYLILACFISNKAVIFILLGGFLIRLLYFWVTPYGLRTHDVEGHIPYIEYVLKNWSIPPRNSGWETYQPPLYYFFAALVYKAANLAGVTSTHSLYRLLQFVSLLLSMGFLGSSLLIFENIGAHLPVFHKPGNGSDPIPETPGAKSKKGRFIGVMLGLVAFWPSNIMHSVRIGNDGMFYFFYALGLLFLIKWYYDNTDRSLYTGFVCAALCFITKANALILYGVIAIIYLLKFITDKDRDIRQYLIRAVVLLILFAAGFGITFGAAVAEKMKGSTEHFMVPNMGNLGGQEVGNQLKNYVWFDLPEFITEPYTDPWGDRGGRQYFWNYLFKTGLVGEFQFDTPFHRTVTILLSSLFLGLLGYVITGLIWLILKKEWQEHGILLLNLILLIGAAILFRISIPASCSNDFRYILPVLISFGFFYGYTLAICRRKGWTLLEMAGYIWAVLFMAASSIFMVGLQF
jgi:hypothetical protein